MSHYELATICQTVPLEMISQNFPATELVVKNVVPAVPALKAPTLDDADTTDEALYFTSFKTRPVLLEAVGSVMVNVAELLQIKR